MKKKGDEASFEVYKLGFKALVWLAQLKLKSFYWKQNHLILTMMADREKTIPDGWYSHIKFQIFQNTVGLSLRITIFDPQGLKSEVKITMLNGDSQ